MIKPNNIKNKSPEEILDLYTKTKGDITLFYHGPLSQWWPSNFKYTLQDYTRVYNCAEQAMMAQKALLFDDTETFNKVMSQIGDWDGTVKDFTKYPKAQKSLGREVKGFYDSFWNEYRGQIVTQINIAKFHQNPYMMEVLKLTEGQTLVEASPVDDIWGIGMSINDSNAFDKTKWKGSNLLGSCLTEARIQLLGS